MKAMHSIDLSVPYYKGALSYAVFSQNIDVLASLGCCAIAIDNRIEAPVRGSDACRVHSRKLQPSTPLHRRTITPADDPQLTPHGLRIYERATIAVATQEDASSLVTQRQALETYDIVAVAPNDERAMEAAMEAGHVDIISLDASKKLPFPFRKSHALALAKADMFLEITYGPTLKGGAARRHFISNVSALTRIVPRDRLIVSSGSSVWPQFRSPTTNTPFLELAGLTHVHAMDAQHKVPLSAIQRAGKRRFKKGFVKLPSASVPPAIPWSPAKPSLTDAAATTRVSSAAKGSQERKEDAEEEERDEDMEAGDDDGSDSGDDVGIDTGKKQNETASEAPGGDLEMIF